MSIRGAARWWARAAATVMLASAVPTSQAAEALRSPNDVLSAVTLDMNDDGRFDRAVLLEDGDAATLAVYLSVRGGEDRSERRLAILKRGAAWIGAMWGQQPSLAVGARGSLLVHSANDSIGRDRWSQTLAVAYRNGDFVVAGLAFRRRDALDPATAGVCDLNYLTGQGVRNGKPVLVATRSPLLADWSDEERPKECGP